MSTQTGTFGGASSTWALLLVYKGALRACFYPTSKGAVVNMTRAMAANHAKQGIRVNCVCPGTFYSVPASTILSYTYQRNIAGMLHTPMMFGGGMPPAVREARRKRSLLQTEGNAWDCAAAVRFLSGNEARWITGTVMTVDAGATCAAITAAEN